MLFIEKVINDLMDKDCDLSKTHVILPGRRPIVFFREYFVKKGYEGFMPSFFTIEDFVLKYSGLVKIEVLPLWLEAFQIQKMQISQDEKLDDFLKWIPTLLKDFNDIEVFSESPLKVLNHLASIERIESWGETLSPPDDERLYYKNIKFWENNLILYKELTRSLKEKGLGTEGMILSSAIENLEKTVLPSDEIFVFVGLNAITPKEEKIIKHFISHTTTFLYWDSDEYYINNTSQEAGYFLRNSIKWNYYANKEFQWIENTFSQSKKINVVATSEDVAQAKYAGNYLKTLTEEELQRTALVLCDETIFPSVMESLPDNVKQVNVTMGYPLKNLNLSSFFKQVFQLHIFREKNKTEGFYYQDVLAVLQNPIIAYNSDVFGFIREIKTHNRVFITQTQIYEKLSSWELYFVFISYEKPVQLIQRLYEYCTAKFWEDSEQPILRESYLRFKDLFSVLLSQLIQQDTWIDNFSLLQTFYQHILNSEKIDFIGEPLEGLQLMGLLETRLLGFKNIIMLGVNEGILPAGKTDNSFIPFDVKKNYGINTFLENDAIYAYHFYRLLQHAETVTLVYNNFSEGLNSGEKSRFISQLEFESGHEIKEIAASCSGNLQQGGEFIIEKTPALMDAILQWLKEPVSPTHLTSYHYNPIGFYMQKILQIGEKQEVEEEISPLNYGNLIHNTLEALYSPLKGKIITEKDLTLLLDKYSFHLNEYIKKELNPDLFERGQNYLQKLLAEKTIEKIIRKDLEDVKNGNEIFLKDIEKKIISVVDISGIGQVNLKGFIDRWDVFNGQDRIIDYKTSSVSSLNFKSEKLEDIRDDRNFKFFIQLVFYAYMVLNENLTNSVQVGIWSFRKPSKGAEFLHFDGNDIFACTQAFELFKKVTELIEEIANPEIPFVEKVQSY